MNIAFFLVPKSDVIYLPFDCTMRQALEKMEHHRYSAIPLISQEGSYVGTLTEGDLLWKMKRSNLTFEDTEKIALRDVPRRFENNPVRIDAQIEDLLNLVAQQNFVPVVDDRKIFIGLIRRREILGYYAKMAGAGKSPDAKSNSVP